MLKKALLTFALLLGAVSAGAESEVADVVNSSMTVRLVAVSSNTSMCVDCVGVDTMTVTMAGRKVVEIKNEDATANVRCGFNSWVTKTVGGRLIAAGATWVLSLKDKDTSDGRIHLWCANDTTTGTVQVSVTEGRSK